MRVASCVLVCAASFLCLGFFLVGSADRNYNGAQDRRVVDGLRAVERAIGQSAETQVGLLRVLHRNQDSLVSNFTALQSQLKLLISELGLEIDRDIEGSGTRGERDDNADDTVVDNAVLTEDLPTLPESKGTYELLDMNLAKIMKDPECNPNGLKLTGADRLRAELELTKARARVKVLTSEIALASVEAMDLLESTGDYVYYAPGQPFERIPGMLGAARKAADGSVRMFYLPREEFGEIYEKREERRNVARTAAQRLLAMFE